MSFVDADAEALQLELAEHGRARNGRQMCGKHKEDLGSKVQPDASWRAFGYPVIKVSLDIILGNLKKIWKKSYGEGIVGKAAATQTEVKGEYDTNPSLARTRTEGIVHRMFGMQLPTGLASVASDQLEHLELRETYQRPGQGGIGSLAQLCPNGLTIHCASVGGTLFACSRSGLGLGQADVEELAHTQTAREDGRREVRKDLLPEFWRQSNRCGQTWLDQRAGKRQLDLFGGLHGILQRSGSACAVLHIRITQLPFCAGMRWTLHIHIRGGSRA